MGRRELFGMGEPDVCNFCGVTSEFLLPEIRYEASNQTHTTGVKRESMRLAAKRRNWKFGNWRFAAVRHVSPRSVFEEFWAEHHIPGFSCLDDRGEFFIRSIRQPDSRSGEVASLAPRPCK